MPNDFSRKNLPLSEFSTERAMDHVRFVSQKPHYVGSDYHQEVWKYLEKELQKLGLETQIQIGNTLSKWGNLVKTTNVMARIKGTNNSKALLLLTHYDSAPHSNSYGASDDANGLGTILEGIRTFLHNKTSHKNDIIILFSDGEELGLNGAFAFTASHSWAQDVGLVINFEARGTKGPSMMLAETNFGNENLIREFSKAKTNYPVSNSLMYSVYKMLPNDTDLTAFREKKDIPGFNLAYIDDHFDYHTEHDNFKNFTPESLEHQASYMMPMLYHFSNTDLANFNTDKDHIYFNFFNWFFHYPFSWNWILFGIATILFLTSGFMGISSRNMKMKWVLKGLFKIILLLGLSGLTTWSGWQLILKIYPEYKDILHGFTYNGHAYMMAFFALTISFCFWIYKDMSTKNTFSYLYSILFLWLVICGLLLVFLPGAGFLILPLIFVLIGSFFFIFDINLKPLFLCLLSIPTIGILFPLVELFPIGLGLKIMPGSTILLVLSFGLLIPLIGWIENKNFLAFIALLVSIGFFAKAHLESDFTPEKAKQNSLVYLYDESLNKAYFCTYDHVLDSWTESVFGKNPQTASLLNDWNSKSKYNSEFSFMVDAPKYDLKGPLVYFLQDTVIKDLRKVKLEISFQRNVNRLDVFADESLVFHHLKANGVKKINQEKSQFKRKGKQLLNYYPIEQEPLILEFITEKNQKLELTLRESSLDLVSNPVYQIKPRPDWAIPMPFVLNNAVIYQKNITSENTKLKLNQPKTQIFQDSISPLEPLLNEYN